MARLWHRRRTALFLMYLLCVEETRGMFVCAVPAAVALGETLAVGAGVAVAGAGAGGLVAAEVAVAEVGLANAWNPVGWVLLSAAAVGGLAIGIGLAASGANPSQNVQQYQKEKNQVKQQFDMLPIPIQRIMTLALSGIDSARSKANGTDCHDPQCQQGVYCYRVGNTVPYCGRTNHFQRRHAEHVCQNIPHYMASSCKPRWFALQGTMVKVVCMKCEGDCEWLCNEVETHIIQACKGKAVSQCSENVRNSR